jgi:RNA-directed DNA polymerase
LRGRVDNHRRVVRGGAFNNNTRNVRCAYRNNNDPDNLNRNQGFRPAAATLFQLPELPGGQVATRLRRLLGRGLKNGAARSWPVPSAGHRANTEWPRPLGTPLGRGPRFAMYIQLCSWENLLLACRRASKGKRGHPSVATFEYRLEDNLLQLREELLGKTYHPGAYTSFYVHDPKRRLISAAPFRDRVVHHALCNVIEPIFERSFIADSYANRVGKGAHRALDRCQQLARRFRYVLQCDVQKFFPSIDHTILCDILSCKIPDPDVMWLVGQILESGTGVLAGEYEMMWFPGDDLFAALRPRGLPIGNLTSQFWANCYMNAFDHFVKRELRCCKQRGGYLRYVDDMAFFADNKYTLWTWRETLAERLSDLRLTIHPGAHPRPVTEGIPFLGFVVFPTHRRLKRRKGIAFQRRFKRLLVACAAGDIPLERVNASVQGWVNHARFGDTWGLRRAVLGGSNIQIGKRIEQ